MIPKKIGIFNKRKFQSLPDVLEATLFYSSNGPNQSFKTLKRFKQWKLPLHVLLCIKRSVFIRKRIHLAKILFRFCRCRLVTEGLFYSKQCEGIDAQLLRSKFNAITFK